MAALSGGNQQKVVLARWLEQSPRVMLLHEPTQGVDVATRQQIYELMRTRAAEGVAILWVTTDFDELATMAHRILLCAGGVIAGHDGAALQPRPNHQRGLFRHRARRRQRGDDRGMTTNVNAASADGPPSSA